MTIIILAGIVLTALSKYQTPVSYMLPVIIGTTGFALLVGVCVAQALQPYPESAGTASALLSFSQLAVSSLIIMLLNLLGLNAVDQLRVIF